jgi:CheY-like chemotaxis protein
MKKILVVDDDMVQRGIYEELFKENDFEVTVADDGLDAYRKFSKVKPDLLFTGIMMPNMTGFELINNLRKDPLTANIPVIMFSHLGREEDRKKAHALPLVHFVVKGFDSPKEILEKARNLVSDKSKPDDPPHVPMV